MTAPTTATRPHRTTRTRARTTTRRPAGVADAVLALATALFDQRYPGLAVTTDPFGH